jgi:hypothetical protein
MKKVIAASALFLSITPAFGNTRVVIDELRKLNASLSVSDPSHHEISLRLADRLADQALLTKDQSPTQAENDRLEAISLYQANLGSRAGEAQIRIQFQLARLYSEKAYDAASLKMAKELFQKVSASTQTKELKRESFLRLAEFAETITKNSTEASDYYRQALSLCEGTDSCSFSHYRLAWIERNQDRFPQALEEMKQALWDSKGQLREEAARDLVSFMGLTPDLADQNISFVDSLSKKVERPALLEDLAFAYLSNGFKQAGVKVLALTHARHPTVEGQMRLMEEYYGLRQWDQFRAVLSQFEETVQIKVRSSSTPATAVESNITLKNAAEVEKVGRRLATQLDGERTTDSTHFEDFKKFTLTYLQLFPDSSDAPKIMEGLIAAEKDPQEKLSRLKEWLGSTRFHRSAADEIRLRELRASIAQKQAEQDVQANAIVMEEMDALILKGGSKVREYRYQRARSAYAMKNFAVAIPEFEALSNPTQFSATEIDVFAIQSQHLLLDVFNQQKDFSRLIIQSRLWTENTGFQNNAKIAADLKEMKEIAEQAGFESAIARGQSLESLDLFLDYCKSGKFVPKSCDNAKVLAISLNQHPKLIQILEVLSRQDPKAYRTTLIDEYENGGYFEKTALAMQENSGNADFKTRFKTALMFEVARNNPGRDSVLKTMSQAIQSKKLKLEPAEEKVMLSFLNDARLLRPEMMSVLTQNESKGYLAEQLEEQNIGNQQTLKVLLSFDSHQGSAWSKRVIEKAEILAAEEAKIKFHGRNGQVAFQKRVNRLKELNQFADRFLSGADAMTRSKLLSVLKNSHEQIATEIMQSPIPQNLNSEQVEQIQAGLSEMAKPFQEKVTMLQQMLDQETQKVGMTQSSAQAEFDEKNYQVAIGQLNQNPKEVTVLRTLKSLFETAGLSRPAAYFEGRIQGL